MRVTSIAALIVTLLMAATPLMASYPVEQGNMNPYGAAACAAPGYGTQPLQPGCCRCQPNCCDDAWAGYCQKKHHGFSLPCVRPLPHRYMGMRAANCSSGNMMAETPLPGNYPMQGPTPTLVPPSEKTSMHQNQPTPAPQLPPLPPAPPASKQLKKPQSNSPSDADATSMPFPVFNPAAWKIGAPIK